MNKARQRRGASNLSPMTQWRNMVGYLEEYVIYSDEVTPAYESLACTCVLQKKVMIEQNVPIVILSTRDIG
jgi:hypothetical protein